MPDPKDERGSTRQHTITQSSSARPKLPSGLEDAATVRSRMAESHRDNHAAKLNNVHLQLRLALSEQSTGTASNHSDTAGERRLAAMAHHELYQGPIARNGSWRENQRVRAAQTKRAEQKSEIFGENPMYAHGDKRIEKMQFQHVYKQTDEDRAKADGIEKESQDKRAARGEPLEQMDQFYGENPGYRHGGRGATPTMRLQPGQKLYHTTSEDWHADAVRKGLDTKYGLRSGRWLNGNYKTSDEVTGAQEQRRHNRDPKHVFEFTASGGHGEYLDADSLGSESFTTVYNRGLAKNVQARAADPNDPLVGVAANSHAKPAGEEPSKNFVDYDQKLLGQRLNLNPTRSDDMKIIKNHTSTPVPDRVVEVAQKERLKTALQEMTSRRRVPAARDKD